MRGSALDLALPQPVAAFAFDQADSNKTPNSAAPERPAVVVARGDGHADGGGAPFALNTPELSVLTAPSAKAAQ